MQLWRRDSARPPPSPFGAALKAFLQAALCMGVYMYLIPRVPLSKFASLEYQKWGFWHRLWFMYLSGFTARWKYYFIWSISEVAVIISGLGFSGWTTPDNKEDVKPTWTRAENVDILKVEFAQSGVEIPKYWNISTGTWLRHCKFSQAQALILIQSHLCDCTGHLSIEITLGVRCVQSRFKFSLCRTILQSKSVLVLTDVYERLPKGFSGFPQLLITQLISAVWHVCYLTSISLLSSFI